MFKKRTLAVTLFLATLLLTSFVPGYRPALAQQTSPVAPRREQVQTIVREAYEKFKNDTGGKNADYIPVLAQMDSKLLGFYGRAAGEKLKLLDEVYKSEAASNTGNKALSMLLAKYDRIYADPFE